MKIIASTVLLLALTVTGCSGKKDESKPKDGTKK